MFKLFKLECKKSFFIFNNLISKKQKKQFKKNLNFKQKKVYKKNKK